MPRIFKYGDILNITFTPDKEINILIYSSPSYLIIYRSHTLLKMVRFFWPTLYIPADSGFGGFPSFSRYILITHWKI